MLVWWYPIICDDDVDNDDDDDGGGGDDDDDEHKSHHIVFTRINKRNQHEFNSRFVHLTLHSLNSSALPSSSSSSCSSSLQTSERLRLFPTLAAYNICLGRSSCCCCYCCCCCCCRCQCRWVRSFVLFCDPAVFLYRRFFFNDKIKFLFENCLFL